MQSELLIIDPVCLHSIPTIRYATDASVELLVVSIRQIILELNM